MMTTSRGVKIRTGNQLDQPGSNRLGELHRVSVHDAGRDTTMIRNNVIIGARTEITARPERAAEWGARNIRGTAAGCVDGRQRAGWRSSLAKLAALVEAR
jgi:hypothetical protein